MFAEVDNDLGRLPQPLPPVRLVIIGGAAIALRGLVDNRLTVDVDVISEGIPLEFWRISEQVGERFGAHPEWINASTRVFSPLGMEYDLLWSGENLQVYSVDLPSLLASKVQSARRGDLEDVRAILSEMGGLSSDEILDLVERKYPHQELSPAVEYLLDEILEEPEGEN